MLDSYSALAGQFFGVVSLILCLLAFSSKRDDRLMVLLLSANVAFALQFVLFASWTAAALTVLVIVRIALARRYPGSRSVMAGVLVASGVAALLTWQGWADLPAVVAMAVAGRPSSSSTTRSNRATEPDWPVLTSTKMRSPSVCADRYVLVVDSTSSPLVYL